MGSITAALRREKTKNPAESKTFTRNLASHPLGARTVEKQALTLQQIQEEYVPDAPKLLKLEA